MPINLRMTVPRNEMGSRRVGSPPLAMPPSFKVDWRATTNESRCHGTTTNNYATFRIIIVVITQLGDDQRPQSD